MYLYTTVQVSSHAFFIMVQVSCHVFVYYVQVGGRVLVYYGSSERSCICIVPLK